MNRYRRLAKESSKCAIFGLCVATIAWTACYSFAVHQSPMLAILSGATGGYFTLTGFLHASDAVMWNRRDKATKNTYL